MSNRKQVWVDEDFEKFIRELVRKKSLEEKQDFSFREVTQDIVRNTEIRNGIEEKLLRRIKRDETNLF